MRFFRAVLVAMSIAAAAPSIAGEADTAAARGSIEAQLQAFLAGDDKLAYSYAAPNVRRVFPSVEIFMGMVESGYRPVRNPSSYSFGKTRQTGPSSIAQQVFITGPDGKEYEALYTLELQPDGVWRITGVSLKASNALST